MRTLVALKKLVAKIATGTVTGNTVDEVLDYAEAHFDITRRITYDTAFIDRYEGGTAIYRVYGVQDITGFTSGVYTKEIAYDAEDKQMVGCGCSASVNFGTSPQTYIVTSGKYGDLEVKAGVTGGSGTHKVVYTVTDTKETPNAATGILYYWYEYKAVS